MRITFKVSGAGNNGLCRLPFIDADIDRDLTDENENLDEGKCRALLANNEECIQISSRDCKSTIAFAIELLEHTRRACEYMIANRRPGNTTDAHAKACCRDDEHAERNMKRGRLVYVRADIDYSHLTNTIKLRIDLQNPKNVIGVTEQIALDYALILARVANNIADQLSQSHGSTWKYQFVGGPGCPDIFDDARHIESSLGFKKKAETCPNHNGEFCSPIDFSCPCQKGGKCCWQEAAKC